MPIRLILTWFPSTLTDRHVLLHERSVALKERRLARQILLWERLLQRENLLGAALSTLAEEGK